MPYRINKMNFLTFWISFTFIDNEFKHFFYYKVTSWKLIHAWILDYSGSSLFVKVKAHMPRRMNMCQNQFVQSIVDWTWHLREGSAGKMKTWLLFMNIKLYFTL